MNLSRTDSSKTRLILFLALSFLILLLFLGRLPPIGSSSEAREAQVVWSILKNGEWVLPLRNGIVPSKPPLFHWMAASLSSISGLSPHISCRYTSALAASAVILLTLFALNLILPKASPFVVLLGFFSIATNYEFLRLSADCRVDMTFSLFCTAAILAQLATSLSEKKIFSERIGSLFFFFFCGLAVLVKGPLGFVLPFLTSFLALVAVHGIKEAVRRFAAPAGWIILIVFSLPWYMAALQTGTTSFLNRQLIFENWQRFFGGEYVNQKPFYYYITASIRASFPWSILFAFAFLNIFRKLKQQKFKVSGLSPRLRVELASIAVVLTGLLFFSLSAGKRYAYLAPLFPFASISVVLFLNRTFDTFTDSTKKKVMDFFRSLPFILFLFFVATLIFFEFLYFYQNPSSALYEEARRWLLSRSSYVHSGIALSAALSVLLFRDRSFFRRVILSSLLFLYFFYSATFLSLGVRNHFYLFEINASRLNGLVPASSRLKAYKHPRDEAMDPLFYYLYRDVEVSDLKMAAPQGGEFIIVKEELLGSLSKVYENRGFALDLVESFWSLPDRVKGDRRRLILLLRSRHAVS